MYAPAIVLVVSSIVVLCSAQNTRHEYDDLQKPEEDVSLGLVAGIPYGSVSGRVAEYFATLKTPLRRKDHWNSDLIGESVIEIDSNN